MKCCKTCRKWYPISDTMGMCYAPGEFRRMLEYKAQWYGSKLLVANRYYPSSKTCSVCGHVMDKMPLHIREWTCQICGTHHDRDANAAMNLLALAD